MQRVIPVAGGVGWNAGRLYSLTVASRGASQGQGKTGYRAIILNAAMLFLLDSVIC